MSASFILVIRVKLKNGEVLSFVGDSGYGEGNETYYKLEIKAGPDQLGNCGSVRELMDMLQKSVGEDQESVSDIIKGRIVLTEHEPLMKGLDKIHSMDEIECISINADQYSRERERRYWHYTYYRDNHLLVYDEGGSEEVDIGTGGRIAFIIRKENAICGKNYGKGGIKDAYHEAYGWAKSYDAEIEPDEAELKRLCRERQEKRNVFESLLEQRKSLMEKVMALRVTGNQFSGRIIACDWYEAFASQRLRETIKKYALTFSPAWGGKYDAWIDGCSGFILADIDVDESRMDRYPDAGFNDIKEHITRLEILLSRLESGRELCVMTEKEFYAWAENTIVFEDSFRYKMGLVTRKQTEAAYDMAEGNYQLKITGREGRFTNLNRDGAEYETSLLDCTCQAYRDDRERNGVCKHMIALAMILGWQVERKAVDGTIPKEETGPIPEEGMDRLKEIAEKKKEQLEQYIQKVRNGAGRDLSGISPEYRDYLDVGETVEISGKHFTLAGIGDLYIGFKKAIEAKGGVLHEGVVQKDHYLVVCLATEPENKHLYQSEIAGMIDQVLANRAKKGKTKIVTDTQLISALR